MKTFKKSLILCVAICAFCANWSAFASDRGILFMEKYNPENKPNGFELLEPEMWFDIPEFNGIYQCSTYGRIKALKNGAFSGKYMGYKTRPEKIMKGSMNAYGYFVITLYKNKVRKNFTIHRIIASVFHRNPENKPQVNHKDGIKTHNWPSNLEWATTYENMQHAVKNCLMNPRSGEDHPHSKKVINTRTNKVYDTIKEAAKESGLHYVTFCRSLKGETNVSQTDFKYL